MKDIIISPIKGNVFFINVSVTDKLSDLKNKIGEKLKISSDKFFLSFKSSKIISINQILSNYIDKLHVIPCNSLYDDIGKSIKTITI